MMKSSVLLKHLDSPVRILTLSVNDFMGYVIPFFIGVMLDSVLIVPICGLIIIHFLKKVLRRLPQFYLVRRTYWALPTRRFNKFARISWPSSSKRFWVK